MKAETKSKLSLERSVVVIVVTFRTQQSVTSSECFRIDINYSEAKKREEGRGRRAEVRENEEQVIRSRDGEEEME